MYCGWGQHLPRYHPQHQSSPIPKFWIRHCDVLLSVKFQRWYFVFRHLNLHRQSQQCVPFNSLFLNRPIPSLGLHRLHLHSVISLLKLYLVWSVQIYFVFTFTSALSQTETFIQAVGLQTQFFEIFGDSCSCIEYTCTMCGQLWFSSNSNFLRISSLLEVILCCALIGLMT